VPFSVNRAGQIWQFTTSALLSWVLLRNVGSKPVTRGTFLVPVLVVAVAAGVFLTDIPTVGNDVPLDVIGAAAGAVLGVAATGLTRIRRTGSGTVIAAGAGFVALWITVIGGRIAFAQWATGLGSRAVDEFSVQHHISGADAWTAAFVLMALTMVLARAASTMIAIHRSPVRVAVPVG